MQFKGFSKILILKVAISQQRKIRFEKLKKKFKAYHVHFEINLGVMFEKIYYLIYCL